MQKSMDLSKLSKQDLMELLQRQAENNASGLMVKLTAGGGVYIKHDSFREFSVAKNKEYTAGINIGYATAKALFGNPALLKQVSDSINALIKMPQ